VRRTAAGFVDALVDDEVVEAAVRFGTPMLSAAPLSIAGSKAQLNAISAGEVDARRAGARHDDGPRRQQRGLQGSARAFAEKRKPRFVGASRHDEMELPHTARATVEELDASPAHGGVFVPFSKFAATLAPQSGLRAAISAATRRPEPECIPALTEAARMPAAMASSTSSSPTLSPIKVRGRVTGLNREGLAQQLMQEFALSSDEGVALMCVAESLSAHTDTATRDALIRDKLSRGDWRSHLGRSESLFVNAATWGLF
jgi:hypothetical protein